MQDHTHKFSDWPFPNAVNTATYCTANVARLRFPVLLVSHDADGDWQFLDATTDVPGECVLLCLGCVYERDATLAKISDLPRGWSAWRAAIGSDWERGENPPEESDDKN